jgi:hypothetical protein
MLPIAQISCAFAVVAALPSRGVHAGEVGDLAHESQADPPGQRSPEPPPRTPSGRRVRRGALTSPLLNPACDGDRASTGQVSKRPDGRDTKQTRIDEYAAN